MPTDCDKNKIELTGYSLQTFYNNLSKIPAKNKIVVIDACFSGTNIFRMVSGIGLDIDINIKPEFAPNTVIFTACKGDQLANWYLDKEHGLFTYYFLKAICNKNADGYIDGIKFSEKDGSLSYQEIFNYISCKSFGIPNQAKKLDIFEQIPTMSGGMDKNNIFLNLKH